MSHELFSPESVAQDSPRLTWKKRHGIEARKNTPEEVSIMGVWSAVRSGHPEEHFFGAVGTGETEDEALADLALRLSIKTWNEETA